MKCRVGKVIASTLLLVVGLNMSASSQSSGELDALHRQVLQLYDAGKYGEAVHFAQHALTLAERLQGPDHPLVGASLNVLGGLYAAGGHLADAEQNFVRSLAIRERTLGPYHPDVADLLNNLGALNDVQGHYAEAEPFYERSLAIRVRALGPNHPDVAVSLGNLKRIYRHQGRDAEAESLSKR